MVSLHRIETTERPRSSRIGCGHPRGALLAQGLLHCSPGMLAQGMSSRAKRRQPSHCRVCGSPDTILPCVNGYYFSSPKEVQIYSGISIARTSPKANECKGHFCTGFTGCIHTRKFWQLSNTEILLSPQETSSGLAGMLQARQQGHHPALSASVFLLGKCKENRHY